MVLLVGAVFTLFTGTHADEQDAKTLATENSRLDASGNSVSNVTNAFVTMSEPLAKPAKELAMHRTH